ncbi:type IV secretory system conjugative DNA transfer family protein [Nocardia arthritidis]|uniref:TraM recognition domain-containing protein n=1 Tax=Nocardia arthritidis TaxID=228602 RepID=A0A6G9Y6X0_9NOCA|nr:TraM recognition domain-containing protein [Nocardia arthritidis]QIS08803.1 TraM recognition domain-containing protein [Nocardia arthritidis]
MKVTRETRRPNKSAIGPDTALIILGCAVIVSCLAIWAAVTTGRFLAGMPVVADPAAALIRLAKGTYEWPWQSSVLLAAALSIPTAVIAIAWRRISRRSRIDYAARTMQPISTLSGVTERDVTEIARRLMPEAVEIADRFVGVPLGLTVSGGQRVYLSWEMPATFVSGTRTGKTMAWAVPSALCAPGALLSTSNKPDLYIHTRYGRERRGRVWLCDLQGVTGTRRAEFWWNPLRHIETLADARKLASFFSTASKEPGARVDAYFDGGACELLSMYILAAACADGDLQHAAEWLGRDQDETPVLILRLRKHHNAARRIKEMQSVTSRQRDGLFDMARRFLGSLSDQAYAQVVTPPARSKISVQGDERVGIVVTREQEPVTHNLPEFDPDAFVNSSDSLYPLSMEGPDSAAPLMTALVGQILEAALTSARRRPDGRLRVPLLAVLDEAANCCKLAELPNYYTYAGGHGLCLMTFLQVLEQGVQIWGQEGLHKMFAQSVEVYGGGCGDTDYLRRWVDLIGPHEVADTQISTGRGNTSYTRSWRSEPIFDVAELAALPKERAVIRFPGNKPVLVRKTWWTETEFAADIRRSIELYGGQQR